MEPTKNFSNFLDSSSSSGGSTGSPRAPQAKSLSSFLDEPQAAAAGSLDELIAQEGAQAIKPIIEAIYKQESGAGANSKTSVDGAKGGMQIIPGTFQQYAKPGERIDNPADNLRVGVRIIKDLASRFGNDPAKVAAGYFSGAGNVNQGGGSAWKTDHADGNGKRVSSYVSDVLQHMGLGAKQPTGPDLSKAPKWTDIEASEQFNALGADDQQKAKQAYFDYWIAPHAGAQADALRSQFMSKKAAQAEQPETSIWDAVKGVGKSVVDALTPAPSILERPHEVPKNPNEARIPVSKEFKAQVEYQWDAATPEQRAALEAKPGVVGMLARQRAGLYQNPGAMTELGKMFDRRVESRRDALIQAGEDARFAQTAAQFGAATGVQPGLEIQAMATAKASGYDFDSKELFDPSQQGNGLNNAMVRGLAKGGLGISKAITGYGEFLSDVYGLDDAKKLTQGASKWARGKEEAIGERGDMLSRNFEGAVSSIAQQLPLLVTGVAAGSQAIPLAGMAVQTFGQEYSDGRAQGQDTAQAATRASIFAAFEVIGERFGLGASMQALKGAARGMPSDQIIGFMAEALKKEIPGEVLTTTGQFATDKFAPGGVGLNPNATLGDYIKQVADTIVQTVMQAGVMTGGTTGVSAAVRHLQDNTPGKRVVEADAMRARDVALGKWESGGLTTGLNGRVEPTMPAPEHQMVTDAQKVVAELASAAGLPLETVLPTPVVPAAEPVVQDLAPMQEENQGEVTDQDVLTLANSRYQQLREKRDGATNVVAGDDGLVEQHGQGSGLSERERAEMAALEASRGDVGALRKFYGLDQQVEDLAEREARLEREAMQADDTPTTIPQNQDDDIPGFDSPANQEVLTNGPQATQAQQAEPAQEVRAQEQDQPTDRGTEARQEPRVPDTGSASLEADGLTSLKNELDPIGRAISKRNLSGEITLDEAKREYQERRNAMLAENATKLVDEAFAAATPKMIENALRALAVKGGNAHDAALVLFSEAGIKSGLYPQQNEAIQAEVLKRLEHQAPAKPKTEKEAKQRKAIERIAKGSAYFGSQEKATGWIADNGLVDTHEARKTGASRWDVVAKDSQGGSQGEQAGGSRPTPGAVLSKPGTRVEVLNGAATVIGKGVVKRAEWGRYQVLLDTGELFITGRGSLRMERSEPTEADTPNPTPGTDAKKEEQAIGAASQAEMDLRKLSRDKEEPGDVLLQNGRFVSLEQAVDFARKHMQPNEWAMPFQFNRVLDIAPRDWSRMVEAMKAAPETESTNEAAGLVVIPAEASEFADMLADEIKAADGDERLEAIFQPGFKKSVLPKTVEGGRAPKAMPFMSAEDSAAEVKAWKDEAKRQGKERASANADRTVISLFDASGVMSQPWRDAGYNVVTYDLQNGQDINDFSAEMLLDEHGNDKVWAVIAQPPCTDFASSGAQWWKEKDEDGRTEASNELVRQTLRTIELLRPAVWLLENPVGRIAEQNNLPDPLLSFDPWHFGDPWTKRTMYWGRFNNQFPTAPVEPTDGSKVHKLSSSNKYERSLTPEGVAYAAFMANNAEGMSPAQRMAYEFAGVDQALFEGAFESGTSEYDVRTQIEDAYHDGDLETVRETLEDMAGEKQGTQEAPAAADDFDAMFDDVLAEELAKDNAKKAAKPKTEKEAKQRKANGKKKVQTRRFYNEDGSYYNADVSDQYVSYEEWIADGNQVSAGMREQINADERLFEGESDRLLKMAGEPSKNKYGLDPKEPTPADVTPSILKPLTSAGKNSAAALTNAIDGLGALFGGPGKLSSGFTFDEETYAKAKPLFQAAVANLEDAGKDLREAMRAVVRLVLDKFGAQAAQNMKPYAVRFIEDFSTASKTVETTQQPPQNAVTEKETANAIPVQPQDVSDRVASQGGEDAAAGDRDSQPVGTGVAEQSEGADPVGRVPASTGQSRTGRTESSEQSGVESLVEDRDRAGVRSEPGASNTDATDHVIDAEEIGKGGLGKKFRDNIAAIKLLKEIEAAGRAATPDERKTLAKFVGWGAMKGPFDPENKTWEKQRGELSELLTPEEYAKARASVLDAHYTSPIAVGAMFDALADIGFSGGRILEPSVGIGNFFGLMPSKMRGSSQLHGVELDSLTSRMVAALYPKAKIAKAIGFEDFDVPNEYFDLVIGNPPFGNTPLVDSQRSQYSGLFVHNYFLAKGIDKLRPGGLMAVVVTHNFLDAQDSRARKWIGERANLVAAARLPNTAFKENAGTEVVTDILIFQKKGDGVMSQDVGDWQTLVDQKNVNPKTGDTVTHKINKVFVDRPALVLGTPSAAGTMYKPNEYTVEEKGDIKHLLESWRVNHVPEKIYNAIDRKAMEKAVDLAIPDGVKIGSFYVEADGKVWQRGADLLGEKTAAAWTPRNEGQLARMKGMIQIRDALRTQMRLERSLDATEAEIEANRVKLNKVYDDFVKKFKHLNSTTNRGIFLDDPESNLILGLEFDYDKGVSQATAETEGIEPREPKAKKADIFTQRVAFPPQDHLNVSTAKDALLASLNYRGRVDLEYMQEVYGKDAGAIIDELGDLVYEDPNGGVMTHDEYLAGDVKTKLAEAQEAAKANDKFKRNVKALEGVIPKDKSPSEISASIGASFIPADIYQQFVKHISGGTANCVYVKATGMWLTSFNGNTDPALNTGRFGTDRLSAQDLFQLTMLGRGAVVKETYKNPDGSTTTVVLEKETEAAREKQNAIKAEWQKWLWQDPERADQVATIYNEKMNRIVERKFDGSHLTFPGMSPSVSLLAHQKNGVWRGLQSSQVLLDHVVGAGKTFQMATLAMEMRRLGIARKPLFVVPNHLTVQWRSDFARLYPSANVLAATPEDFSKDKRERLFAKIITGDWDAVIVGHSSLKKIGLPQETEVGILKEQIDELADAIEDMKRTRGDRRVTADMERIRKNLEAKYKEKMTAIGQRTKMVTFDELGIDAMFVDEMHEFKNLSYHTTMDRNPGMGNPAGSAKAFDMFVKVRWLFDTFGAKTPFITATGTPVSNSLVEMFNMQRYMQYPTLKDMGLHVFDAWAKQFGNVENVYEVSPSGSGYRQSTRFAKFTNLPALMSLYNSFADTITLDDLKAQEEARGMKFPVPKIVGGRPTLIVAKRSPMVAALMGVPKAQTDEYGAIQFEIGLSDKTRVEQSKETGKWHIKSDDLTLGQFETEQEAKLTLVEKLLTPKVSVEPGSILGRFADLRRLTKETKGKVNALSLTGEANKAGLDYRLIDPTAPDFSGSKINLAVGKMMEVYKKWDADKGAQLVFCDLSIPLSARSSYSNTMRKLYVRDEVGGVTMKRGTMHAAPGFEEVPYFVVPRGKGDIKRFDVYDAVSGALISADHRTKADAVDAANGLLSDDKKREKWISTSQSTREIEQAEIDDYNNENDVEVENADDFFAKADIAGMSGSAEFSVYDDIKAKLMAKGVPEREIAFIHDYASPTAKEKLFKAVRSGEVRFLLGSTPKMGAGTNVQDRLVGLHHIDAPWRPSDLEQREGRIIRRGNKLYERDPEGFEVFIGRYATEQTYDTRRWQILEHKARGIEQLRNFDGSVNEIEDIDGEAANAADMKAAASGDPLILEETKLRNEVRRLEQLQSGHADEVMSMNRKAKSAQEFADKWGPMQKAELESLIATVDRHKLDDEGFAPITVAGRAVATTKEAAQKDLASAFEAVSNNLRPTAEFTYRGLNFRFLFNGGYVTLNTPTGDAGHWMMTEVFSPSGALQRLKNYVDRLQPSVSDVEAKIEKAKADAVALRKQAQEPFAQARELDATREQYKAVQRALLAKGPAVPDEQKPAVAKAIEQRRKDIRAAGYGEALDEFFANKGDSIQFAKNDETESQSHEAIGIQRTERSARNIGELLSGVIDYLKGDGQTVDDNIRPYVAVDVRGASEIDAIAKTFGLDIQWFDLADGLTPEQRRQFGRFNGAYYKKKVFLRAKGVDRPHLAILGHEVAHELRRSAPDLYDEFVDAVNKYIKPGEYKKFLTLEVANKADDPREEFSGEVLSDLFMERDFWQHIGEQSPTLLGRLAEIVTRLVDKLMHAVGYTKRSAPFVTDYRKVMEIATDIMVRYKGRKVDAGAGIKFAAKSTGFDAWFGDSKITNKDGSPKVVYHGTRADFSAFSEEFMGEGDGNADWGEGFYFTDSTEAANGYAEGEGGNVMPVYLSIKNPATNEVMMSPQVQNALDDGMGFESVREVLEGMGFDGIAYFHKEHNATEYVAFEPGQIKSAIGNNGEFDPDSEEIHFNMQDVAKRTSKLVEFARKAQNDLIHFFGNQDLKTFTWYDKTVASQYHKALKDKHFGKVYSLLLGMQNHVAMAAVRAAQVAPGVLPRVDDMKTAAKEIFSLKNSEAMAKASKAIFAGTLHGENVLEGKVWTDDELRNQFAMDDTAIGLYRQARAAINASIDEVAAAEGYAMAHKIVSKEMRAKVIASPNDAPVLLREEIDNQIKALRLAVAAAKNAEDKQAQAELTATLDSYKKTLRQVEQIFTKALNLKLAGYAPLMRFGNFTVEVQHVDPITGAVERDEDGKPMTIFFGRFETQREANKARANLEAHFKDRDDVRVSAGTYNPDKHQLYVGVTPETLELFADAVGAGRAVDEYIRLTRSDRSSLKRQLERAGTPGFSDDLSRVVSNFITSNARHSAQQFYMNAINNAVKYIPKEKGDVQQEAQKLRAFVLDSKDAGAVGSSLMFAWFLGGSVAAAAVNATQPLMVTMPYLSQFVSPVKASAALTKATPRALGKAEITDTELKEALHKASLEGIVDAQEIFHLYSLGSRQLAMGTKSQAALTLWGSLFSAVEGMNRRLTFIAAWDIAKAKGMQNPYAFAVRAVNSTQGIYNKVNRPNLARSAVGRLVFTYKGYALMVTELMARMWKAGPDGKKAVAIMLAMLVLAAGEEGLPGAKALDDIIDSIGQLMGYDTNMRRFKRRHAYEILGKAWGDFLLYGASSQLPLDFGGRLGLGSMIPGTELLKTSSANQRGKAVGEIVGPSAGMAQQVGDAMEAAAEGNYGQAAQNLAPKAVRDVAAAVNMVRKGYATDAVGRKVVDVGLADAAIKAVGFQPTVIANEHRKGMPIQQDIALQQMTEASIVTKWAKGIVEDDEQMVKEAQAKMDEWNRDNPDTAIAISPSQIKARARLMATGKEDRLMKAAPKEMRGRVGLDLVGDE